MDKIFEQYFDFGVMFDPNNFDKVLDGFIFTIKLSIIAGVLSLVWGLILAVLRPDARRFSFIVRWPTIAYIDIFRGVPALLTILIVAGSLGALSFGDGDLSPLPRRSGLVRAALTVLVRGDRNHPDLRRLHGRGLQSRDRSRARRPDGGGALAGDEHGKTMRFVVVPQAIRKVIPPLLNDYIALMKDTTLVSVIGLIEVVQAGRDIQSETLNSSALMLGALMFIFVDDPARPPGRLDDRPPAEHSTSEARHGVGVAADFEQTWQGPMLRLAGVEKTSVRCG